MPFIPPKPALPAINTVDSAFTALLVAMPFSDGGGSSVADISGNAHNGTTAGGTTWVIDGTLGTVLQLDGTSGYVTLDNAISGILSTQSTATVAFWLKLRNNQPGTLAKAGLVTLQGNNAAGFATYYPALDGKLYSSVFRQTTIASALSLGAVDKSGWHHLAITTISNGNYTVYINGVQVAQVAAEFGVTVSDIIGAYLGRSQDVNGFYYLDGWIGDFRAWTRILIPTEIASIYNNPWSLYQPSGQQGQFRLYGEEFEGDLYAPNSLRAVVEQRELLLETPAMTRCVVIMADLTVTEPTFVVPNATDPFRKVDNPPTLHADTITSGLQLALPVTEGSGTTAADYSGNANNGALTGTSFSWVADVHSAFKTKANVPATELSFGNPDGRLVIPRAVSLEPAGTAITLEAWIVYGGDNGAFQTIISKVNDLNGASPNTGAFYSYLLGVENGSRQFYFRIADDIDSTPGNIVRSATQLVTNTSYHVLVTYNGSFMRMYVNGVQEAQTVDGGNLVYNSDTNHDVYIGNDEYGIVHSSNSGFIGRIDYVNLWNRVLTVAEIKQRFGGPFGIYMDIATAHTIALEVEYDLYAPNSARVISLQPEFELLPPACVLVTALMADMIPAIHNANFGLMSASPVAGTISGGTTVIVRGYNLSGVTSILVGGVALTNLTILDQGSVQGVTGAHVSGLVDIQVTTATQGTLIMPSAFAYTPAVVPNALRGIVGAQMDSTFIQSVTVNNEATPSWPGSDTTLALTLPDVPISPACVEVTLRKIGQPGGVWMRYGSIYDFTVDMANKKIIWKTTAAVAIVNGDELTVRAAYQGN